MKKRDRRTITPSCTSLTVGKSEKQSTLFDDDFVCDAVPESTGLKADTSSAIFLDGEGTSRNLKSKEDESKDIARIISKEISKIDRLKNVKVKISKKNNYRVPVLNPDGTPAMPTTNRRANKWLKEKKAKIVKNKLGIFRIQLLFEPSGRNKQDIVLTDDPGSAFTGIAVISKKAVLYGCTLELPGYKKGSKPKIVVNKFGKKIEKYPNAIVDGMTKRRELRRSRRHRNCRRRECRFLNRSKKNKIPPSILSRKQLELKVIKELVKIYPINIIGYEDVAFNHFKDKEGVKGQFFSHIEVGKNWILDRLKKIAPLKIIKGYETNIRRQQLGLKKEGDKTVRDVSSHVNDCIAIGSIILGIGIEVGNKFKFDTITRPKYSRRMLHLEQPSKGGVRRRYGGTAIDWTNIRKGDYVEAIIDKKDGNDMIYRGWVSGYTNMKGQDYFYISDFDWKGFGKNRTQTAIVPSNLRLLNRNNGLLIKSMEMIEERVNICKYGTVQESILDAWK